MSRNQVMSGSVLEWSNATGSAISSGDVVVIGNILGVAQVDIADGASGAVSVDGVFTVPKATAAVIAQGEPLTWDVSAGNFDDAAATPETGDLTGPCAVAAEAAGAGVTTLAVRFTGVPGTVTA